MITRKSNDERAARYIDAEKIEWHTLYFNGGKQEITYKDEIDALPAEDVAPIIHAYWIDTEDYTNHYGHIYECSNCHREVADDFIAKHTYCLHCGAKMDEEEEE